MRKSVKRKVRNKTDFQQFYVPLTTNSNGNNDNANEELFKGKFETSALPSKWGNAVPYVIITNNTTLGGEVVGNLVGKFQEFANWKTRKGIPAKVAALKI